MSVINLSHRLTSSVEQFEQHKRLDGSLIYVDHEIEPGDGDASLDLTVGEAWFRGSDSAYFKIEEDGLPLKPGQSCVVETNEEIGVPANAFGLVTGKGKYIFLGVLLSPGKMDPGFRQKLKIGLYNAGQKTVKFKRGEPFCTVCFLELEPSVDKLRSKGDLHPEARPVLRRFPTKQKLGVFLKEWAFLLSNLIALASLVIAAIVAWNRVASNK